MTTKYLTINKTKMKMKRIMALKKMEKIAKMTMMTMKVTVTRTRTRSLKMEKMVNPIQTVIVISQNHNQAKRRVP